MKKLLMVLPMLLLAIGMVSAYTFSDISVVGIGDNTLTTSASVSGYDYGVGLVETAEVGTSLDNEGTFIFDQQVITYGNGQEWPNQAPHEWAMLETQTGSGSGDTIYMKDISIWTVKDPWYTTYEGIGNFETLTQDYEYTFNGFDQIDVDVFQSTDEPFRMNSYVFVNPFTP